MTKTLQALAVAAVFLFIPVTTWSQGSATTQPISEMERAALFPSE